MKVPSGSSGKVGGSRSTKKKRPAKKPRDAEDFISSMDLSRVEDDETIVCPKCGTAVDDDVIDCPKCGVNVDTGRMSERMRKKKSRGGPDADKFYETAAGNSWNFMLENHKIGLRSTIYGIISSLLMFGSLFMVVFCAKMPLKFFWSMIAIISGMSWPGWIWYVHIDVIKNALLGKKKGAVWKHPKYDFFLNSALGIKFVLWQFAAGLPFQLVTGTVGIIMMSNGNTGLGIGMLVLGQLPLLLLFPIAMSHFAMPIQWPGWVSPIQVGAFFKGLAKPCFFWAMFFFLTMLPALACLGVIGGVFGSDITDFLKDVDYNARVAQVDRYEPPKNKSKPQPGQDEGGVVPVVPLDFRTKPAGEWWLGTEESDLAAAKAFLTDLPDDQRSRELDAIPLIAPGVTWLFMCAFVGYGSLFNMRSNGLLTYYHRPELNLNAEEKDLVYVAREKKYDEHGEEIPPSNVAAYLGYSGGIFAFYAVANIVCYFVSGGKFVILPRPIAKLLNLIN